MPQDINIEVPSTSTPSQNVNQEPGGDHLNDSAKFASWIETRISSNFCWYTCVIYFQLVTNLIFVYFAFTMDLAPRYSAVSLTYVFLTIAGCILAIWAKVSLSLLLQKISFFLLSVSSILGILSCIFIIITYFDSLNVKFPCDNGDNWYMFGLGNAFSVFIAIGATIYMILLIVLTAVLVLNGYELIKLMCKRKNNL